MVTKKYKFPIQIFFFFEKINPGFFTSKVLRSNVFFVFLPMNTVLALSIFFKNELFLSPSYVVDASCVDAEFFKKSLTSKQNPLVFYIFYFFFLKLRIITCFLKNSALYSIDSVYQSTN